MANEQNLVPFNKGYDPRRGSKPKGSKHLSTRIREMLDDPDVYAAIKIKGKTGLEASAMEALITVAMVNALADHLTSIKWAEWLAKYGYGNRDIDAQQPSTLIIKTRYHRHTGQDDAHRDTESEISE